MAYAVRPDPSSAPKDAAANKQPASKQTGTHATAARASNQPSGQTTAATATKHMSEVAAQAAAPVRPSSMAPSRVITVTSEADALAKGIDIRARNLFRILAQEAVNALTPLTTNLKISSRDVTTYNLAHQEIRRAVTDLERCMAKLEFSGPIETSVHQLTIGRDALIPSSITSGSLNPERDQKDFPINLSELHTLINDESRFKQLTNRIPELVQGSRDGSRVSNIRNLVIGVERWFLSFYKEYKALLAEGIKDAKAKSERVKDLLIRYKFTMLTRLLWEMTHVSTAHCAQEKEAFLDLLIHCFENDCICDESVEYIPRDLINYLKTLIPSINNNDFQSTTGMTPALLSKYFRLLALIPEALFFQSQRNVLDSEMVAKISKLISEVYNGAESIGKLNENIENPELQHSVIIAKESFKLFTLDKSQLERFNALVSVISRITKDNLSARTDIRGQLDDWYLVLLAIKKVIQDVPDDIVKLVILHRALARNNVIIIHHEAAVHWEFISSILHMIRNLVLLTDIPVIKCDALIGHRQTDGHLVSNGLNDLRFHFTKKDQFEYITRLFHQTATDIIRTLPPSITNPSFDPLRVFTEVLNTPQRTEIMSIDAMDNEKSRYRNELLSLPKGLVARSLSTVTATSSDLVAKVSNNLRGTSVVQGESATLNAILGRISLLEQQNEETRIKIRVGNASSTVMNIAPEGQKSAPLGGDFTPEPANLSITRLVEISNDSGGRNQKIADQISKKIMELFNSNFIHNRNSFCQLACIPSAHYATEKKLALSILLNRLAVERGGSGQPEGILELTKILIAELHFEKIELESTEFRQLLLWVYASVVELVLSYSLRRLIELTSTFKRQLSQLSEDLSKLNSHDVFLSFQTTRIKQATAYLLCEYDDSQWTTLQAKFRSVLEVRQKSRELAAEESIKGIVSSMTSSDSDEWFTPLFSIGPLFLPITTQPRVLMSILNAISISSSTEFVMGGLELLYHVIRENNATTQKLAMEGFAYEKSAGKLNQIPGLSQWSRLNDPQTVFGSSERCYKIRTMALIFLKKICDTMSPNSRCCAVARTHLIYASQESKKDRYSTEIKEMATRFLGYTLLDDDGLKKRMEADRQLMEQTLAAR